MVKTSPKSGTSVRKRRKAALLTYTTSRKLAKEAAAGGGASAADAEKVERVNVPILSGDFKPRSWSRAPVRVGALLLPQWVPAVPSVSADLQAAHRAKLDLARHARFGRRAGGTDRQRSKQATAQVRGAATGGASADATGVSADAAFYADNERHMKEMRAEARRRKREELQIVTKTLAGDDATMDPAQISKILSHRKGAAEEKRVFLLQHPEKAEQLRAAEDALNRKLDGVMMMQGVGAGGADGAEADGDASESDGEDDGEDEEDMGDGPRESEGADEDA